MNVRDQLMQLAELGLTDQRIKELKSKEKQISQKVNEAKEEAFKLAEKEKVLDAKNTELTLKRKKLDGDLQQEKINLRKWETRAEKIKGEREYTALISEIGSLKKAISNIETHILEVMEEQEALDKDFDKIKENLRRTREKRENEWVLIKDDLVEVENKIQDLVNSRSKTAEKMPPVLLKRYDQIAVKRAGVGVAWIKNETCQACSRTMPPELFLRVAKAELLEQCPSCQRILVTQDMLYAIANE